MSQEKRNKILLLSLVGLTLASGGFYFLTQDEQASVDKSIFKVEALEQVDRVELTYAEDTVAIAYTSSRWRVNDRYPADPNMIDVLFATLREAEPKRPVARALSDSIASSLKQKGIRVTLFSGKSVLKSFLAGGNAAKTQAFFMEEGSDEVYLMAIPGYRVYASGIFEIGEGGFRSKYVFDFNWRNFKSLKASFPATPKENFEVSMGKEFFTIQGMSSVDTAKLNSFLDRVSVLEVDEYPGGTVLGVDKPVMVITIEDVASRKYELEILPPLNGRAMARVNSELVFFDNRRIQPLLKPRSFFAGK
jgi:hypothetical protein